VVLFVSYSGVLGGAERLLVDYASCWPGTCALACPPGPLADAAAAAGVHVFPRPRRSLVLRGSPRERLNAAARLAAHALEVRALARSLDPDLVVAWGMRSAIASMLAGVRYAFHHNDLLPGPLVGMLVRSAAARATSVVALSEVTASELRADAVVVHPGVDVDAFESGDRDPADPPEVVVLGAIVRWKRPDLALEAVALARRRIPGLRLRLVGAPLDGDGSLLSRLRARAAEPDLAGAVELAGHDPDPRGALGRCVCLLHCAPREPFGLAVLESLAAGRPAVVPASCGPAEIVDDSCGVLYEPGDAGAAAAALVDLVSDPARAAAMGQRGRERARQCFDRPASRARFHAVIGAAAGAGRPGRPGETGAGAPGGPRGARGPGGLAIVTVTHDSARELEALLGSVDRHLPGTRVVVVDSGSADASARVARSHPGVTLLALGENLGFGRACNRGLELVTEPVAALLNPDVELIDDSLLALAAEAGRRDLRERLLAPRVLNGDGSIQDTVHPRPGSAADLVRALVPPAAVPAGAGAALAPWRSQRPRRVGWAVGCALVAQTRTLTALGPFDESLFMYGEDLELGLHAHQQGIETWLWPAARVVHHRAHAAAKAFGGEAFERLARGRHQAVAGRLGRGWGAVDDGAQMLTFASRMALKRALGRPTVREQSQLAAVRALRREPG
jgi:GT2 family glycosyltransferase/glycosyltransferase involved in cell wall biosynthesis